MSQGLGVEYIDNKSVAVLRVKGAKVATFPHPSDGVVSVSGMAAPVKVPYHVAKTGDDLNSGLGWDGAFLTVQKAVDKAPSGSEIRIAPGDYTENVVVPVASKDLTLIGYGGHGAVRITALANGVAMTNEANDVTLVNIALIGAGTGGALVNRGDTFRAYSSRLIKGTNVIQLRMGSAAQIAAGTKNDGSDSLFYDCEVAYAANGVVIVPSDYGAVTQAFFKACSFHGITTASFKETIEVGALANVSFRDLHIEDSVFGWEDQDDDGIYSLPAAWISLGGHNNNNGVVTRCSFPDILAGGRNICGTSAASKLRWVANFHEGGISTGQPS